jgi:glucokinase
VVVHGRLVTGALGSAGELGHQTIVPGGRLCGCGNRGCLEAVASASALTAAAREHVERGEAPHLAELLRQKELSVRMMAHCGDRAIAALIDDAIGYLGIGIANVVTVLHPELVVLGGGMTGLGARLFDGVRAEVARRVRMFPVDGLRIELSETGMNAALLGGLALAGRCGEL